MNLATEPRQDDKNKESLKVKLMLRRPFDQLVDQEIAASLKSSPSFHESRQKLERAKMGETVKHKIQKRPELILEDNKSLEDHQRQLKRARLSDKSELVEVNILHAEKILAAAAREGGLPFHSDTPDEDSGSDGTFSPSPPYDCNEHSQGSLPSVDATESSPLCSRSDHILDYVQTNKNRKKTKPKTQPKARTIKFHEYKGPPNAQKNSSASVTASTEPSYEILLQQQQLQLQWQLEWLQKNPQAVLQTPQSRGGDQIPNNPTQQICDAPASPQKLLSKLEDMKVSDLKSELKKRNLPVSGSKPLLIERLKSYSEIPQAASSSQLPDNVPTADEGDLDTIKSLLNSTSSNSSVDIETADGLDMADVVSDSSSTSFSNEDIVQLQQRFIEKLQRELERSQLQLQQSKNAILSQQPSAETKSLQRQILHQYLQQKILQQRILQEEQKKRVETSGHSTLTALLERRSLDEDLEEEDEESDPVSTRCSSLPSFSQFVITRPPPDYNEATRQLSQVKQQLQSGDADKSSPKNQMVEDVLEILIKNGELHPSAAQETEQDVFFSKPMTCTSSMATPPTVAKDLRVSLQSVLELTPPSSAGFCSAPTSSLDFDFSLDMSEIEGMDLEANNIRPTAVPDRGVDRSMDMDLIEWLEVLEETHPSSLSGEPLFSTSDLFASDDIDFKPQTDLSFLPWGDKTVHTAWNE